MKDMIWITWEYQVRNRNLSKAINVPLYEIIHETKTTTGRYIKSSIATLQLIKRQRPQVVFHQSPSIVLAFLLALLKPFFGYKIVVDVHNAGIKPAEGKYGLLNAFAKFSLLRANLLIIHNEAVRKLIPCDDSRIFILPDPLPSTCPMDKTTINKNEFVNILFICRWSADEPYEEVFKAARLLFDIKPNVRILITGKIPKHIQTLELPENIQLLGFVETEEYNRRLVTAHGALALTTRTDSLNCAGYEAMACEVPMILSDSQVLRDFFSRGYIYTQNTATDIASNIQRLIAQRDELKEEIGKQKRIYSNEYTAKIENLKKHVNALIDF
ncbi:MAG: hypothetical protein CL600_00715 [Alteromonas sp.]|nr:hypothetical protein [Alteromonas sp.]